MSLFRRDGAVPADVLSRAGLARGDKALACTEASDGAWLLGTRRQLTIVGDAGTLHLPWESIEDAAWDQEAALLRVTEIGTFGEHKATHTFTLDDPALLLQLVRERVTASIVLQRWFPVTGTRGVTVIGRRSPVGGPVTWMHAYDEGLDPSDPEVAAVADAALAVVRAEVGDSSAIRI